MTDSKNGIKRKTESKAAQTAAPPAKKYKPYLALAGLALLVSLTMQRTWDVERFFGALLVSGLLVFTLYRDIVRYQPPWLRKRRMLLLLGIMVVGTLWLGWLAEQTLLGLSKGFDIEAAGAISYGIPLAAGAMLVALLFDFHTALAFSLVVSLLGGLWQQDAGFAVYVFLGSLTAAFSMIRCKKRTAILWGGIYVLAANLLALVTLLLFHGELFTATAPLGAAMAVACSVAVVATVSLALPILESVFKVTTDISLLELLDLDQPLMKSLMISAPGTYHHSIIVGNLVEACAEDVGVNPLLARVGAYYHDIGKVKMPEYFIENQPMGVSKHEKLTPHMSSMILTSHVKEGVELAAVHKLPEEVIDIIKQHHGNALITYFYEKAKGQPSSTELSEQEYKYPGPKPQTRIAALIMMADAVEAASRVLNDPTPSRISALVDKIINHIFLEGQLDECELTLKDIHVIKSRFTRILTGILHKRVDYPGFEFNREGGDGEGKHKQPPKEDKARQKAARDGQPEGPQPAWTTKDRT